MSSAEETCAKRDQDVVQMRKLIEAGTRLPWRKVSKDDLGWLGIDVSGLDPSYPLLLKAELPEGWYVHDEGPFYWVIDQNKRIRLIVDCYVAGDSITVLCNILPRFKLTTDDIGGSICGTVFDHSRIETRLCPNGKVFSYVPITVASMTRGFEYSSDEEERACSGRAWDVMERYMERLGLADWRNPRAYWDQE